MDELKFDKQAQRIQTYTAHLIDFVEEESKRIDEENKGLHRRDGGRVMQTVLFLNKFLKHIFAQRDAELREKIENMFYTEKQKNNMHAGEIDQADGYNQCVYDVLNLLDNKEN